jgi:hypothetical protein
MNVVFIQIKMGKELHIGMGIALIGVDDTNRNNDKESLVNKVM